MKTVKGLGLEGSPILSARASSSPQFNPIPVPLNWDREVRKLGNTVMAFVYEFLCVIKLFHRTIVVAATAAAVDDVGIRAVLRQASVARPQEGHLRLAPALVGLSCFCLFVELKLEE